MNTRLPTAASAAVDSERGGPSPGALAMVERLLRFDTTSRESNLGLIESVLRFYYRDDEDPDRVVAATFSGLFWFATIGALIALPFARPLAELVLDVLIHEVADLLGVGPEVIDPEGPGDADYDD